MLIKIRINHLVPVACVHNRGVSAVQVSGLEGSHCVLSCVSEHTVYLMIYPAALVVAISKFEYVFSIWFVL